MTDVNRTSTTSQQGGKATQPEGDQRFNPKKQGKKGGRARYQPEDNELSEEDKRTLDDTNLIDENI